MTFAIGDYLPALSCKYKKRLFSLYNLLRCKKATVQTIQMGIKMTLTLHFHIYARFSRRTFE